MNAPLIGRSGNAPRPVVDGIHFGSRWVLSGKGDTGNTYEVIPKSGDDHPCDYRLRLVELGAKANDGLPEGNRFVVGSEIDVSPEWFTVRARRAS